MATIDNSLDLTREQYYMSLAYAASAKADCPAAQVGAVLVVGRVLRVTGHNGAQEGPSCYDEGCVAIPATATHREYARHLHAEMDVLLTCARNGIKTQGADLFVTMLPCYDCMKFIIHADIETVWFPTSATGAVFPNAVSRLAETCGVALLGI